MINQSFFSDAIAGIEEVCAANGHSLIICQSHETYRQECVAIETLIRQNVDCILISISAETKETDFLEEIIRNEIELIQFDRYLASFDSYKIINDNKDVSYQAVNHLIGQGYKRIAFLGGPQHLIIFKERKEGYLKAIKEAELAVPYNFIIDDVLSTEAAIQVARELLSLKEPPDAFFTVSDHQALGILKVAESLGINIPLQLGLFGFANESFSELIKPTLSSIDQKSKELGKCAAHLYFENIRTGNTKIVSRQQVIKSEIVIRQSSLRTIVLK